MIIAKWRNDVSLYKDADAQVVAEELRSLGESFKPKDVVEKARTPETELHKCFEWDDTKAAELYRLRQARSVVECLIVEEVDKPKERPPVRVFYALEAKKDGEDKKFGYVETRLIIKDTDKYEALLAQAKRELQSFKAKYSCLVELREIMALID